MQAAYVTAMRKACDMDSQFYTKTFPKYDPVLIELVPPPLPVAQGVAGYPSDAGPIRIGLDGCVWRWVPGYGQQVLATGDDVVPWLVEHATDADIRAASRVAPPPIKFPKIYEYRVGSNGKERVIRS